MTKLFTLLILLSFSLLLGSCSKICSSLHYTKGTECLNQGNFQEAVDELEQAVELDPYMARNHNNLCCAYLQLHNWDKAWHHAKKAVLCPYPDGIGDINFVQLCMVMVFDKGLSEPGTSQEKIIEELGDPDVIMEGDEIGTYRYFYGTCEFLFKNHKLVECKIIRS